MDIAFLPEPFDRVVAGFDASVGDARPHRAQLRKPGSFATANVQHRSYGASQEELRDRQGHHDLALQFRVAPDAVRPAIPAVVIGPVVSLFHRLESYLANDGWAPM